MSRLGLAKSCGVAESTIRAAEREASPRMGASTLEAVLAVLGLSEKLYWSMCAVGWNGATAGDVKLRILLHVQAIERPEDLFELATMAETMARTPTRAVARGSRDLADPGWWSDRRGAAEKELNGAREREA